MSHSGKRLRAWLRRLARPRSWPVRWRLAAVSSGLTLAILLIFGITIGEVATQRIRSDFDGEVQNAAQTLSSEFRVVYTPLGSFAQKGPNLKDFVLPDDASARVLDINGNVKSRGGGEAASLGPVEAGLSNHGGMRVGTALITSDEGELTGYVQYGRSLDHVDSTVNRLWLFIAAGIFGATLLASLAGVAIAARAMRPIASLTATARKIATTRDPSLKMPEPAVDDEVGELTQTLEQMLRSLDAARSEREGAMQKQREFVADASHELRTPLTSVLANLELLQTSLGAEEDEDREIVDSALRSSRRMSRLVADLLLLARADAGRHGERRRCDLAEIAGDAAAEVAPVARDHQLVIDNPRPVFVEGNADELHRMVLNLLDNAAGHTPPGSRVELSLRDEGGDAVLEIADDGPGIPAEMRRQVFDRFVRGEGPADVAGGQGTGLGLAIVRSVVDSHGGSVEIADSASGGALFRVRIPLAAKSEKAVRDPLKTL